MSEMNTGHFLCEARILYDQVGSRDEYPFNLPAFKNLHGLKFHPKVTYVIGENGMGKSTLLEAIAIALGFNPEGGTKDMLFSTKDTHSPLHQYLRLSRGVKKPQDGFFLRAESVYNRLPVWKSMVRAVLESVPCTTSPMASPFFRFS